MRIRTWIKCECQGEECNVWIPTYRKADAWDWLCWGLTLLLLVGVGYAVWG